MPLLWDYIENKLPKPLTWEQLQQKWREEARIFEEKMRPYREAMEQDHDRLVRECERLGDLQNAIDFGY